jgi:hypothetical protein
MAAHSATNMQVNTLEALRRVGTRKNYAAVVARPLLLPSLLSR